MIITTSPFKVIDGGGEVADKISRRIFKNEEGRICMEVRLGNYTATLPLPEHLAGASEAQLSSFFDTIVPEMIKNLREIAMKDRKKLDKKLAKHKKAHPCSNGSTKSMQDSPVEMPVPRQPH